MPLVVQAAGARLREAQLAIVQEHVERQVSQLATLQEDRQAEVQSGHNSGLIRDKRVGLWRVDFCCVLGREGGGGAAMSWEGRGGSNELGAFVWLRPWLLTDFLHRGMLG